MHTIITLDHYLGPYKNHPQMQSARLLDHAHRIIEAMNELCSLAEADGIELEDNPYTGNAISGQGNGGARPSESTVGASKSAHKDLRGLDRYDPKRRFMRWLLSYGLDHCQRLDVYLEHPQWTRTWAHGQIGAPGDGLPRWTMVFVPYADLKKYPPTCKALSEQKVAGIPSFPFKEVS